MKFEVSQNTLATALQRVVVFLFKEVTRLQREKEELQKENLELKKMTYVFQTSKVSLTFTNMEIDNPNPPPIPKKKR